MLRLTRELFRCDASLTRYVIFTRERQPIMEIQMTYIRTVKPELFTHEDLFLSEVKYALPLRLAFIGLFCSCDKEGRFKWYPNRLKIYIAPFDNLDFSSVLDALLEIGLIKKYENNGEFFGCIPTWNKHQCVNNRERSSVLPPIEESTEIHFGCDAWGTRGARRSRGREGKGKERNRREQNTLSNLANDDLICENDEQKVFAHWQSVMKHPSSKLDVKRKKIIADALKLGYSVQQLCDAIQGCAATPHNMGQNDRGEIYDGLHLIFRSENIDRFIRNHANPPRIKSKADQFTQANIQAGQKFIDRMQKKAGG